MKSFIIFTIVILSFLMVVQNCLAVELLLKWPEIGPNNETLGSQDSVPELINYIYKFALLLCGLVALFSIIIGAFQYATSAGDSSKITDAKDRITQALLGILILLAAVLILRIINPDLIDLGTGTEDTENTPTMESYKCRCCVYDVHMFDKCDPITAITETQYWPQTCNSDTIASAKEKCNLACHAKNCVLPLDKPQNQIIKCTYKISSCE